MTFDPLVEERVAPDTTVPRHDSGDPMILPRGGTELVRYSRASSLAGYLAYHGKALADWRGRYEAQGIARRRDLAARIAAVHYSTGPYTGTMPIEARKHAAAEIDECRELAAQYMGVDEAANVGTAGHSLTEPGSAGEAIEENLIDVVAGYNAVTAAFERVASEVFVANDRLRAAGTFDSAYISPEHPGFIVIGDTKTGKNYHQAEFEIQLAVYQGGEVYQTGGGRLTFEEYFGLPVYADEAYLVHVSVTGAPKPRVVRLDLARGRRLAEQAAATRDGRAELDRIGIGEKVDHKALAIQVMQTEFDRLWEGDAWDLSVEDAVARARELAVRFKAYWPDEYTERVKARIA